MKIIILIFFTTFSILFDSCGQNITNKEFINNAEGNFYLIGLLEDNYLFKESRTNNIYKLEVNNGFELILYMDSKEFKEKSLPYFFSRDLEIYYGEEYYIILYYKGKKYEVEMGVKYSGDTHNRLAFAQYKNYLFVTFNGYNSIDEEYKGDNLRYIDLNNITDNAITLPFKADNVQVSGEYVYFSTPIYSEKDGTIGTWNILRLNPTNWNNPELIIKNNYTNGWFVFPENKDLIYCTIYKDEFKNIILNTAIKSYSILSKEDKIRLKPLSEALYIKERNMMYFLDRGRNEQNIICTYLVPFPKIPDEFPNKF
ncbi:MAG: hypothetical protein AB7S50_14820 [Bacteroidales bacterium]